MPRYDIFCDEHGVREAFGTSGDARARMLRCPECNAPAEQRFSATSFPQARIDAAGEDSRDPQRIQDGTAQFNMGLRGIDTEVGRRPDGTTALAYRPITNHEVGSNRKAHELAKRQGLIPVESGTYRPLGSR